MNDDASKVVIGILAVGELQRKNEELEWELQNRGKRPEPQTSTPLGYQISQEVNGSINIRMGKHVGKAMFSIYPFIAVILTTVLAFTINYYVANEKPEYFKYIWICLFPVFWLWSRKKSKKALHSELLVLPIKNVFEDSVDDFSHLSDEDLVKQCNEFGDEFAVDLLISAKNGTLKSPNDISKDDWSLFDMLSKSRPPIREVLKRAFKIAKFDPQGIDTYALESRKELVNQALASKELDIVALGMLYQEFFLYKKPNMQVQVAAYLVGEKNSNSLCKALYRGIKDAISADAEGIAKGFSAFPQTA